MKRIPFPALIVAAVAFSQLGATDCGQIIKDPGFDLWCGDRLCHWRLDRGEIAPAPTWHQGDDGVEMIGSDVAFSQMTPVNSWDTNCIRFEMLADVEETAEVHLEADVFGDGTVDWSERIPTSSWERISLRIGVSGTWDGIRFRLTKVGSGRAVLAQIEAETATDCPSFVEIGLYPLGASCSLPGDCDSGICNANVCSECELDSECGAGNLCGRHDDASSGLRDWHACEPAGSAAVGEPCFAYAECASGACSGEQCGECGPNVACAGGVACDYPIFEDEPANHEIGVCPIGDRASGEPCIDDSYCASGVCDGTPVGMCDGVGEICVDSEDCPSLSDLFPGTCTLGAVAGGTCQ